MIYKAPTSIKNQGHLSEKLSDFHEILYTAADFELDERHVIKYEKGAYWTYS